MRRIAGLSTFTKLTSTRRGGRRFRAGGVAVGLLVSGVVDIVAFMSLWFDLLRIIVIVQALTDLEKGKGHFYKSLLRSYFVNQAAVESVEKHASQKLLSTLLLLCLCKPAFLS